MTDIQTGALLDDQLLARALGAARPETFGRL
ncbi:MAG: hypothetical protein QOF53_3083, partial [Nocardioidaceae bacterium]|nr:hypothetical protein [Nocardioidaceae bacterium]